MRNVVSWPGGFIATGLERGRGEALHIRIWKSRDGRTWEEIPSARAGFENDEDETIFDLTTGDGRLLVAVGRSSGRAAAWRSTDGVSWKRVVQKESLFGVDPEQALYGVTAGGSGFVAVGEASAGGGHERFVALLSDDGIEWRESSSSAAGLFVDRSLHHVTATNDLLFAAGGEAIGADVNVFVWRSLGGEQWVRARSKHAAFDGPRNQVINALAVGKETAVAVGVEYGRPEPAIWFSRLP